MNIPTTAAAMALGLFISGCSGEEPDKDNHVFKEKTQTIDQAREVEGMLKDAAGKKKKAAEDSSY